MPVLRLFLDSFLDALLLMANATTPHHRQRFFDLLRTRNRRVGVSQDLHLYSAQSGLIVPGKEVLYLCQVVCCLEHKQRQPVFSFFRVLDQGIYDLSIISFLIQLYRRHIKGGCRVVLQHLHECALASQLLPQVFLLVSLMDTAEKTHFLRKARPDGLAQPTHIHLLHF